MKKLNLLIVLFTLFISSCSAKIEAEETLTPKPTNTTEPTHTPTRIPLSEIDFEGMLIMDGDLPAGYSGAQIRDNAPEMFKNLPEAQNTIYQQFAKDGETAGGVTVLLFESQEDIKNSISKILAGMGDVVKLDDIGDTGQYVFIKREDFGVKTQFGDLLFQRCNAVVHIRMSDIQSEDSLIAYAKRLDKRLTEIVCP